MDVFKHIKNDFHWLVLCLSSFGLVFFSANLILQRTFQDLRSEQNFRTAARDSLQGGPAPQIVFLGSSHIYTGVDPRCFKIPVLNLADSSYDYRSCLLLYKHFRSQLLDLPLAVVELDPVLFYTDTLQRRNGDYGDFYQWGVQPEELNLSSLDLLGEMLSATVPAFGRQRLTPRWFLQVEPEVKLQQPVPGFEPREERITSECEGSVRAIHHASIAIESPAENYAAFFELLSDLEEHGTRVVLLTMPHEESYWQYQSKVHSEFIDNVWDEVGAVQNVVARFEYGRHKAFRQPHFADGDHLNSNGSRVVSLLLSESLEPLLNVVKADQRD